MKEYYQINEISKLYGIGQDSLRYYEKIGILDPRRASNGYRMYSLKNIYKLNIIRSLRRLGFSMKQIKDYLDEQSVENSIDILEEEQEHLEKEMLELIEIQASIQTRIQTLRAYRDVTTSAATILEIPDRNCLRLHAEIVRDEEADLAFRRLVRKHENQILRLGETSMGAMLSPKHFDKGRYDVFESVFLVTEDGKDRYDFRLPKGRYLSLTYRGAYTQSDQHMALLVLYAKEKGLHIVGVPFEFYHIDNRFTSNPDEYVTEIQVQVV